MLVAPLRLLRGGSAAWRPHDGVTFWLVRWLLFRLMFASGVVKLTSRCPTWWGLTGEGRHGLWGTPQAAGGGHIALGVFAAGGALGSCWHLWRPAQLCAGSACSEPCAPFCCPDPPAPPALTYHYETQCIPTPGAWFAHQLPVWFQKFSVVATYVIEIAVPVLFFAPARRLRLFAFYCQVWGQSRDPCPTPAAVGLTWAGGQEPPSTVPPPALPPLPLRCCCSSSSSSRVTTTSSMHSPSSWPSHCWTRSTWGAGWAAPGGDIAAVRPPLHPASWGWGPVCGVPRAGRGQVTVTDRPVWV